MTGVILMGGKSRRFGQDKVMTTIGDKPLIEHVIEVIAPLMDDILLVGPARPGMRGLKRVDDLIPGCGPMGGIYTALKTTESIFSFVFAADMPTVHAGLVAYMQSLAVAQDVIVPAWSGGVEPLHAIYNRTVLKVIEPLVWERKLRIDRFFDQVAVEKVLENVLRRYGEPHELFANINTPQDVGRLKHP